MADDDDISRRYRELPREEPPRHLDDAILAAARRAVHTRPAPLVVPSGRQRWYFPLAAAAIIVLAVAVTVHVEREQPAEDMLSSNTATAPAAAREAVPPAPAAEPAAPARAPSAPAGAPPSQRRFEMRDEARAQKPPPAPSSDERARNEAAPAELQKAPTEQSAGAVMGRVEAPKAVGAPPPQAVPPPEIKPAEKTKAAIATKGGAESQRRLDEGASSGTRLAASAVQSPEQWLQGIADLRKQARHEEADKELAEFRKRYPDYKIPLAMRERVERR